jgi:hypothetical protein
MSDTSKESVEAAITYWQEWARDVRAMNGHSVDADRMEMHANMLDALFVRNNQLKSALFECESEKNRASSGYLATIHETCDRAEIAECMVETLESVNFRLRDALERIQLEQQSEAQARSGDYQQGYDDCIAAHVEIARAALETKA